MASHGCCLLIAPEKNVIFLSWLFHHPLFLPLFFFLKSYPTKIIWTMTPISGSASRATLKIALLPWTGQSCSDSQLGQHPGLLFPPSGHQNPISKMVFSILARDAALVPRRGLLFIPLGLFSLGETLFSLFSELRKESLTWLNCCNSLHNWTQKELARKSKRSWVFLGHRLGPAFIMCAYHEVVLMSLWKGLPSSCKDGGNELLLSIAFFYQPGDKNKFGQKAGKGAWSPFVKLTPGFQSLRK